MSAQERAAAKKKEQEARQKQRQEENEKKKKEQEELKKQKDEQRKKADQDRLAKEEATKKAAAEREAKKVAAQKETEAKKAAAEKLATEKAKLAEEGGAQASSFWPWSTNAEAAELARKEEEEKAKSGWGWGTKKQTDEQAKKELEAKQSGWGWGTKTDDHAAEADQAQTKWGTLWGGSAEPATQDEKVALLRQKGHGSHSHDDAATSTSLQTRGTRLTFEQEWEDGGSERFNAFKEEFEGLPPVFKMPRLQFLPLASQWHRAFDGPPGFMMPSCEQKVEKKSKKNKKNADDMADDDELAQEEKKRREKKGQPTFTRQYGLQVGFLIIWIAMAVYYKMTYKKQYWRKINLLTCVLSNLMFTATWLKAMWKVSGVLFAWLQATEEHVEEGGEVVALHVRRMIFSRLFRLLIAEDEQLIYLVSKHGAKLYDEPNIGVCLGCMFVDDSGKLVRVAERPEDDDKPGLIFRDDHGNDHEISKSTQWDPWNRPLRYAIDASSDPVDEIVKANHWWNKFENTLKHQQTVLNGYRGYLGATCFDGRAKFIVFMGLGPPLSIVGGFFAYREVMDTANPEVYLDSVLMAKHFLVVLTVSVISNIMAVQANSFVFCYWIVNKCMRVIEAGVNKELFDSPMAQNEDSEDEGGEVEDIPGVWRKLRSQRSIKAIGQIIWSDYVEHKGRKASLVSQAQMSYMKRKIFG